MTLAEPWAADQAAAELLAAIAVPAWLVCSDGVLRSNPALRRLCGLTPEALQQLPHLAMVVAADRDALARATAECLQGSGEPPAQSARLLTAEGGERPVELTLRRVRWSGQPAALITCVDLSDFQHVQSMLQAMSGLLRQIVDGAPVASFVIDRYHRVTHWNAACERLTACAADRMIGSTEPWRAFYAEARPLLADLIVDGAEPAALAALYGDHARPSSLVAGAHEAEAFFPALGTDGLWLDFTAAPLCDHDGQVIGAIVTLQDVSQRRRTEAELTRRLEQLVDERSADLAASARVMDAFIDNAPIGVVYAHGDQVLRSNRRMAEIFGPAEATQRGGTVRDFHLGDEDAAEIARLATPLLTRGQPLHHEMWMRHRSGRPLWVQVNATMVDHRSRDTGTWWMLQDRSEVRAAQQALGERYAQLQATHHQLEQTQNQLLQSDKMASIGQLAAGVAHEINNPVGFVSSNLNTLRRYVAALLALVDAYAEAANAPASADAADRLAQALAAAELDYLKQDLPQLLDESAEGLSRVKKIVQDLKDFSRVDQADWQQADLNAGLESTLNVVRHEVKYKAEVVLRLAPLPLVLCLAGQLNQVFMNLIVNASQAIAEHGVITLASGSQDGWAWVQVDDTGSGMDAAVQRRIFEPFFTTKDVGKGTGLGLSLSFSIVKRHGGLMQVRSVPGQGSAFRVWVPIAGPVAAGGAMPPGPPDWPGGALRDPAALVP
jgi:PAS domain S-box-containing protein